MNKVKQFRIYADTSIFGGLFDEEFSIQSKLFFQAVRDGKFKLVTSAVVSKELETAPVEVTQFFNKIVNSCEIVEVTDGALALQESYVKQGIVTPKYYDDALHVALATVWSCDCIVSWNFKHIVNYHKIPLYNAVNALNGYGNIAIYSPQEVVYE
jgi:predicted nucleic acid-binding protein